ncbi:MAG: zinc ribbon domain-containing protein [Desulfobacterales bacterium]
MKNCKYAITKYSWYHETKLCIINIDECIERAKGVFMPVYEYEHMDAPCRLGQVFEVEQSINDRPLKKCPQCASPIKKIISRINISCPKSNSELRDLGFTKLVRRDDGVYENVTARDGDSRYMRSGKSETIPDLSKTITD